MQRKGLTSNLAASTSLKSPRPASFISSYGDSLSKSSRSINWVMSSVVAMTNVEMSRKARNRTGDDGLSAAREHSSYTPDDQSGRISGETRGPYVDERVQYPFIQFHRLPQGIGSSSHTPPHPEESLILTHL